MWLQHLPPFGLKSAKTSFNNVIIGNNMTTYSLLHYWGKCFLRSEETMLFAWQTLVTNTENFLFKSFT